METIETRLGRLERQNRIYRNLFILAGLALVAVLGYGAAEPVPEVIRARRFEVLNKMGKRVVVMGGNRLGNGFLRVQNNDPGILGHIALAVDGNGHGTLALYANGTFPSTIQMTAMNENESGGIIEIRNKTGETVVQVHVDENGNGVVNAFNRKGDGRSLRPGR